MSANIACIRRTGGRLLLIIVLMLSSGVLLGTPVAYAAGITVTTTTDELIANGRCSLREAIRAANLNRKVDTCPAGSSSSVDIITLAAGTYSVTIGGWGEDEALKGDLDLKGQVAIVGAGADLTLITGNGLDRVVDVLTGASVAISGVTIQNGGLSAPATGGGVRNNGTLTLNSVAVTKNHIDGGYGGGIANAGTLTLTSSTISNNQAIYGGGIRNTGILTINTSTIRDNSGDLLGGGIYNTGTLTIQQQSVISQNGSEGESDASGGGIYNSNKLTITGSTIKGNRGDYGGGLFNATAGRATISGVTIRANVSTSDLTSIGAGIANYGNLMLANSTVVSNTTTVGLGAGGGIYNHGQATITSTQILSNTASYPPPADFPIWASGGGVLNDGTMTISTSRIRGNIARVFDGFYLINGGNGGGINNRGTLTLTGSTIDQNVSAIGGGITNEGTIQIRASMIRDNRSEGAAGILNGNTMTMDRSTVQNNIAGDFSGGVGNDGTMTLTNSTISGNQGYNGGGLANYGTAFLSNMTISANIAYDVAPGILNEGSASTIWINSSTIVGNRRSSDLPAYAGLDNRGSTVSIRNSILASGSGTSSTSDCEGTITSRGYNLVQNGRSCTIVGDTTGNKLNVDPKLGPLQNNGGPTRTHLLLTGSPAIDAASPATPGSGGNACPAKDQRGYARPKDGNGDGASRCDIGAIERQTAASTTTGTGGESDLATPPDPNSEPVLPDLPDPTPLPPEDASAP